MSTTVKVLLALVVVYFILMLIRHHFVLLMDRAQVPQQAFDSLTPAELPAWLAANKMPTGALYSAAGRPYAFGAGACTEASSVGYGPAVDIAEAVDTCYGDANSAGAPCRAVVASADSPSQWTSCYAMTTSGSDPALLLSAPTAGDVSGYTTTGYAAALAASTTLIDGVFAPAGVPQYVASSLARCTSMGVNYDPNADLGAALTLCAAPADSSTDSLPCQGVVLDSASGSWAACHSDDGRLTAADVLAGTKTDTGTQRASYYRLATPQPWAPVDVSQLTAAEFANYLQYTKQVDQYGNLDISGVVVAPADGYTNVSTESMTTSAVVTDSSATMASAAAACATATDTNGNSCVGIAPVQYRARVNGLPTNTILNNYFMYFDCLASDTSSESCFTNSYYPVS